VTSAKYPISVISSAWGHLNVFLSPLTSSHTWISTSALLRGELKLLSYKMWFAAFSNLALHLILLALSCVLPLLLGFSWLGLGGFLAASSLFLLAAVAAAPFFGTRYGNTESRRPSCSTWCNFRFATLCSLKKIAN